MLELKFRVYDKTGGYYIAILDNDCFGIKQVARIILELEVLKHEYIIEQYTGLKDKNGKEIYDGDIVKYSWDFCCTKRKNNYLVEWLSGKVEYYPYSVDSGFTLPDSVDGYMVVGNIHENPELIGKEKQ